MVLSTVGPAIEISLNDKRSYRHLTLGNRLEVVLVHDDETEKSSACVDVRVGSMADPSNMPGLAHFLEHMLFMGTEKYPIENEYSSFLSSHGGMSNAYTDQMNTVYYFDVQNTAFEEALNMFSSFFTCPLFTETATARETNAVDSENEKNLQSDMWRHYQLMKSMAREDHPFHSFSTGNADTLTKGPQSEGKNPRDVVIEFYNKYYSSNIMKLAVYGKDSLDVMQKWVEEKFTAVPDKYLTPARFPSDPYGCQQVAKMLQVVPVRDSKAVDIYFPMPAVEHLYLTKPTRVLSHLIGHESAGSILSVLKLRGWANGLGSFLSQSYADFACFGLSVELTDEGINHIDDVVSCCFSYIGMLLKAGPEEWILQEMKETAEMNFRFMEKTDAASYVTKLANSMQVVKPEHVISGDELMMVLDVEGSWDFLKHFTPENCFVVIKHKGFSGKTTLKEKWYGTDYNVMPLDAAKGGQIEKWNVCLEGTSEWKDSLYLPLQNPFIPTDFTIRTSSKTIVQTLAQISVSFSKKMPELIESVCTEEREEEEEDVAIEAVATQQVEETAEATEEGDEDEEEEEEEEKEGEDTSTGVPDPLSIKRSKDIDCNDGNAENFKIARRN
mmetsp:Transcript_656/g.751  ORF Transcript_656/g.751 Transcript_656/m.751 type:complete len:612 (-) Transcript_656:104-1939(-)